MSKYSPSEFESIWSKKWVEEKLYKTPDLLEGEDKFYSLYSFPYPSGSGLHVGHVEGMVANDIAARYYRMKGRKVTLPMGWDSFGLPAENYAIKTGVAPQISTEEAIHTFISQINNVGISVDWDKEVGAHRPDYYRWTQWIFLQMYKKGFAYKKNAPVNWCPKDQTVLANEQVVNGRCERCDTEVVQKDMEQWFYRMTAFSERLHKDLDKVDWPESTKIMQRNWIGKSEGTLIQFGVRTANNKGSLQYKSYLMGASKVSDEDLTGIGVLIENRKNEDRMLLVPASSLDSYKMLVKEKLDKGYWNEVVGGEVWFLFKHKDGTVQEFILNDSNEKVVNKLAAEFTGEKSFENKRVLEWLYENDFYKDSSNQLTVFTTRVDTAFGATFMVIAPEHPIIKSLQNSITNISEVSEYVKKTKSETELDRQTNKEKTGVKLEGVVAVNPFNKEEIPIFIADYVLMTYGTGAIMAVPAHDERDGAFAKKFGVPIKQVIAKEYGDHKPNSEFVSGATAIIFNKSLKKYLGLRWPNGRVTLVGGGRSKDESFEECADREIHEEVGIGNYSSRDVVFERYFTNYWHSVKKVQKFAESKVFFYQVEEKDIGADIKREAHETFEIEWFSAEELMQNIVKLQSEHWIDSLKKAFIFAKENNLDDSDFVSTIQDSIYTDYGVVVNSGEYSGMTSEEAAKKMQEWLKEKGLGGAKVTYKLRDWLLSRQRYWGCPIPIVYDPEGNAHPVDEADLPILLPTDVDFKPTGESPIARSEEFRKRAEEKYGAGWRYECDTMDTFVDSSWYYFRFCDAKNGTEFAQSEEMNKWLPTDLYMIGTEHTVLHLLYSRFFTKFFFDEGIIKFDEPFYKMRHMGLILGPDGRKMSKRWGNVINPDDEIKKFGADSVRMYEMFMGPLEEAKPWNDRAENGVFRFISKVWDMQAKVNDSKATLEQNKAVNKLIKSISEDIKRLSFNTAVAKFMQFINAVIKEESINKAVWEKFLLVLAPFAPFVTEELWSQLGNEYSIHQQKWPDFDQKFLIDDTVKIAVQINGKVRDAVEVEVDAEEKDVLVRALESEKVKKYVPGKPKKVIFVKNRIMNFIV